MSAKSKPINIGLMQAIIFASSQPVTAKRLAELMSLTTEELTRGVEELRTQLVGGGLELIEGPDGYELEVAAHLRTDVAEALATQAQPLSAAALEVLTIIAYMQPITKSAVDEVRGIASDVSLRTLLARDLVVAQGKQEGAALYRTTNQFLKVLGLKSLKDLPALPAELVEGQHASE